MTEDDYWIERHIEPCPFCDGISSPDRSWRESFVNCHDCGAKGQTFPRNDWMKAIEAWNTRVKKIIKVGCKVRRIHPNNGEVIKGGLYTVTDIDHKEPCRITLKESGPTYWLLLDAFELVEEC